MIKEGEWVSASGNGYYRVFKILKRYAQETDESHKKGDRLPDLVISKKVFNSNLKFSLGIDQSEINDLEKAPENVLALIEQYLIDNPEKSKEIEEFEIPVIQKNKTMWVTLKEIDKIEMNKLMYSLNYRFSLEDLKQAFIDRNLKRCLGNKGVGDSYMLTIANMNYEVNEKFEELYTIVKLRKIHIKGKVNEY